MTDTIKITKPQAGTEPKGEQTFELTVVTIKKHIRCVYLNDRRIVGGKPYVSGGGDYRNFQFTLDDLRECFRDYTIEPKVKA